jgi:hypothetical protein
MKKIIIQKSLKILQKKNLYKIRDLSYRSKKIKFFNFFFKSIKISFYLKNLINIIKNQLKYFLINIKNKNKNKKKNFFFIFILVFKRQLKFLLFLLLKIKIKINIIFNLKKLQNFFFIKLKKVKNFFNLIKKKDLVYNCFIKISKNNIRIHIQYYSFSKLFLLISAGKYRISGINKVKKTMCETMGKLCASIFKKYKILNNIKNFYFFGPKHLIKTFLQNFNNDIFFTTLVNYKIQINEPYNGSRLKKQRRL